MKKQDNRRPCLCNPRIAGSVSTLPRARRQGSLSGVGRTDRQAGQEQVHLRRVGGSATKVGTWSKEIGFGCGLEGRQQS